MSTKETQGKLWSIAPQFWSRYFEPYFMPVYNEVFARIEMYDTNLLDAGCGSGLFSLLASRKGASVIGVDAAPGLLAVARQRNPNLSFLEEDLQTLPFSDGYFDVVAGFNSFQYTGDFAGSITEAKRVLKDGGKLVICIWDQPQYSEATNILKALTALVPPPPPGTPGPFALSEKGVVESIVENAGLKLVSRTEVSCPFLYPLLEDAVKSFMGTGPAANAMNYADKVTVQQTIIKAFKPYYLIDNIYHLQNRFLLFVAEK